MPFHYTNSQKIREGMYLNIIKVISKAPNQHHTQGCKVESISSAARSKTRMPLVRAIKEEEKERHLRRMEGVELSVCQWHGFICRKP
jgi:hypothetical protein